jgi:hypothetical protein
MKGDGLQPVLRMYHAVHHRPHVRPPLAAATSCRRDKRLDIGSFVIGQVARISQVIALLRPVLVRPHWRPPTSNPIRVLEQAYNPSRRLGRYQVASAAC